jgi:hypothetical protein
MKKARSKPLPEYIYKKLNRTSESLRMVAKRAGFKSPSTLSMILSGQRKLTFESATKIARALRLSAVERNQLLTLATPIKDPILQLVRHETLSFSPIHYEAFRDGYSMDHAVPTDLIEVLQNKGYWLIGPHRKWWHSFTLDESKTHLACFRKHLGVPSHFSTDVLFYSRKLLFQPMDFLFIFWKEPTPQFHSLPLSPEFLSGKEVPICDSGIIYPALLLDKRKVNKDYEDIPPKG